MNDYEKFKMDSFETYSFTRLVRTQSLEFFFIRGINEARNFDEVWDGRLVEVLGYLVMYSDIQKDKQINCIYLIEDENKNFHDIILHTKMFASEMNTYSNVFEMEEENFMINKTNVYQKGLLRQDVGNFIKMIVNEDVPEKLLNEIT